MFSDINISQGSVATCLRLDGIFNDNFIADYFLLNVARILKIDQYLAKLWTRVWCLVFFWLTVYIVLADYLFIKWLRPILSCLTVIGNNHRHEYGTNSPTVKRLWLRLRCLLKRNESVTMATWCVGNGDTATNGRSTIRDKRPGEFINHPEHTTAGLNTCAVVGTTVWLTTL